MSNNNSPFLDNSVDITQLDETKKKCLFDYYNRCKEFWIHWTPTIWSLPSVAAAINIGAYSFLFDTTKNVQNDIKLYALIILSLLNLALTIGVWKHRYMQKVFGDKLIEIEKYFSLKTIEFSTTQKFISGSLFYCITSFAILLISFILLIKQICIC